MRPLEPYEHEQNLLMGSESVVADISIIANYAHFVSPLFRYSSACSLWHQPPAAKAYFVVNKKEIECAFLRLDAENVLLLAKILVTQSL